MFTQFHPRSPKNRQRVVGCFHLPNYQITHLLNSAVRTWQVAPTLDFRVFKELRATSHPGALPYYSCFLRPNQLRIRTCPWQIHEILRAGCSSSLHSFSHSQKLRLSRSFAVRLGLLSFQPRLKGRKMMIIDLHLSGFSVNLRPTATGDRIDETNRLNGRTIS
jgi:hypothetical protein